MNTAKDVLTLDVPLESVLVRGPKNKMASLLGAGQETAQLLRERLSGYVGAGGIFSRHDVGRRWLARTSP